MSPSYVVGWNTACQDHHPVLKEADACFVCAMRNSGLDFTIPYLYDTRDHAMHHAMYNVNYAFPFIWMDSIHGTYLKPRSRE